jgi:hypothetical protein
MLSTVPAAVVEPKGKSQNPGAKAKRLKGLLANPDFAEAVEFERPLVKKYKQCPVRLGKRRCSGGGASK